ncbi:MAG TPA: ATP-binding cassette domain-containing protein [Desulfomonilaceae bacterium]|nr:ATP-binding cassette domain-containing protein [Desulfomonilaceae bacterium]
MNQAATLQNRELTLSVRDISKSFGGVRAVVAVNFDLYRGELLGIIGPNGSGKTTLVNLITGFVKPDSGVIRYEGRDITGWMPYRIARLGIARTFQMIRPFAELPAYKNLIIPLFSPRVKSLSGGRYGDRDSVAKDLLEEVGFERESSVTYKAAGSLPHGYLKRLELAKCLALRADLIILDELFSGLSIAELASIVPIIEKLMFEGKTVIMIEHRLRELFRIANRVVVLNYGRAIADGKPAEVMELSEVKQAYLGTE